VPLLAALHPPTAAGHLGECRVIDLYGNLLRVGTAVGTDS
jgi:hypothetical protein